MVTSRYCGSAGVDGVCSVGAANGESSGLPEILESSGGFSAGGASLFSACCWAACCLRTDILAVPLLGLGLFCLLGLNALLNLIVELVHQRAQRRDPHDPVAQRLVG